MEEAYATYHLQPDHTIRTVGRRADGKEQVICAPCAEKGFVKPSEIQIRGTWYCQGCRDRRGADE